MELRQARLSERDEVLDLLAHWFDDRDFFARYNLNDPAFRDDLCLVALDAGRIVSTVQIFDRKLNLGGQAVATGGIGSVYTLADYRKRGIAAALMRLSVDTMEREGFELSLLFAERLDFYGSFGWSSVTRIFSVLPNAAQLPAGERFRDRALRSSARSGRSVRHLCLVQRPLRLDRRTRRKLLARQSAATREIRANTSWSAARCDGRIAAYARAIRFYGLPDDHGVRISARRRAGDARHVRPYRERRSRSFRSPTFWEGAAPTRRTQLRISRAVTHSAHDPELEAALAAAGCAVLHHEDNYYMWRVIRRSVSDAASICRRPRPPAK